MCDLIAYIYTAPDGPTAAPIFSTNIVYVSKTSDINQPNCISTAPCKDIDFAYDCLNGDLCPFDGNGEVNIGNGTYELNKEVSFGNGDLRILGQGYLNTNLSMIYEN